MQPADWGLTLAYSDKCIFAEVDLTNFQSMMAIKLQPRKILKFFCPIEVLNIRVRARLCHRYQHGGARHGTSGPQSLSQTCYRMHPQAWGAPDKSLSSGPTNQSLVIGEFRNMSRVQQWVGHQDTLDTISDCCSKPQKWAITDEGLSENVSSVAGFIQSVIFLCRRS